MADGIDTRADSEGARSEQNSRPAQRSLPNETSPSADRSRSGESGWTAPQITLPKGGGAIRGIGEKFATNPTTGTGSFTVSIAASPGREDFGPKLDLTYDSGSRNGPFGLGWSLSLPEITRRTDKGLPRYQDGEESDIFLISGAEDLVPVLTRDRNGRWIEEPHPPRYGYTIKSYRPRTEGLFARIERWTRDLDGDQHWRSISRDNVVTLYGVDDNTRIADPQNPFRVFSWLISASYDDKGNAILYDYAAENDLGVDRNLQSERHRRRSANRYVKRIRYGNRIPLGAGHDARILFPLHSDLRDLDMAQWMFSIIFDYCEGHYHEDAPDEEGRIFSRADIAPQRPWPARQDPFSSYRSGFEIRTYRLCTRAMTFHHFPDELGVENCLVRSTRFDYRQTRVGSFLERVVQSGHKLSPNGRYLTASLPPLDLAYTRSPLEEPHFDGFKIADVDPVSLANLPAGIDGSGYRWIDLDGEGIAGVLSEQGGAWFYKHNLGDGRFGTTEVVRTSPVGAQLNAGRRHLMDVAGDGNLDLVDFAASSPGFYERTRDARWSGFRTFNLLPNLNWSDPNLRFMDLTGDGIADVLITEHDAFVWHPSLLERGFGAGVRVRAPLEKEETGPRVVFADGTQSIYVADMSGGGLSDIVRIRNGEICYWPNIGYGRFGAKITMDNAPWFDEPDLFEQRRIQLADTDGSGTADILYLKPDGVEIFLNYAGNSWSAQRSIDRFPAIDNVGAVSVVDLLGRGTACLLWSTPLPSEAGRQLRYIDLMCGRKPHLLATTDNNMGAQTRIEYASSTEFYLADKAAGTPWITRLPFPVHVVKRVETYDRVSGNHFVTSYSYHHGFYDGLEREFRGFGRVDQLDTEDIASLTPPGGFPTGENFDKATSVPPVLTKSWFHTGVFLAGGRVSRQLAHEYYDAADVAHAAPQLDDTILPSHLTPFEAREACRTLKGSMLRQEIYALDGSAKARLPYTVVESNFTIVTLQPRLSDRYAVFFAHPRETITLSCEREPHDPRVSHALTLEVDDFGNVLKAATIGYSRRNPEYEEQSRALATLTESRYTNAVREADAYRTPAHAETSTYELTAPEVSGANPLDFAVVRAIAAAASKIAYDKCPGPGQTQKRLIERTRTHYRRNDLTGLLPDGKLESLALPGETYKLAFTPGLLEVLQAKASAAELGAILGSAHAGYRDIDGDGLFWVPSGRLFYSPSASDDAAEELAFARAHFFLPNRHEDPFGAVTTVGYDAGNMFPILTRDPVGNENTAHMNYRALQPRLVIDANGNRSRARFDALGMLAGTVVQGKADGPVEGDSFDDFVTDLSPLQIKRFFDVADPRARALAHLGTATTRNIYDLDRTPVCAASFARETHVSNLAPGQQTRMQLHFVYSDGFGRIAQTKIQAEPGPLNLQDPHAPIQDPRWVGTSATIYNNKGKPVRQYEPFFCPNPHFGIEKWGVSSVLFYDPLLRVVATLHPNATYEKAVFDAWKQATYDVNDTVTFNPATDPDVGAFFRRLPEADYLPTWYRLRIDGTKGHDEQIAAEKSAKHANTPTVVYFDILGRTFLTVADNGRDEHGEEQLYRTLHVLDIEGNQRAVIDALGRVVIRYDYDMLSTRLLQSSMEVGERWLINDVTGKPIRTWNSRGYAFRVEYDLLRRPLRSFVRGGDASEARTETFAHDILFERTIYGDSPDAGLTPLQQREANLRGKVYREFDGAGVVKTDLYDFKGNLLRNARQFARDYKRSPDWSHKPELEHELFAGTSAYDALNRTIAITTPDRSVYRLMFNDASLLEKVDVNLHGIRHHGEPVWTPFVTHINYDAKGQRTIIRYANSAETAYAYDDKTFRLIRLKSTRAAERGGLATKIFRHPATVQDLRYTFDPAGNITRIEDAALRAVFHTNQRVDAASDYTYDPLYRLIEATGREHIGQSAFAFAPSDGNDRDYPFVGAADRNDLQALRNYVERYHYDPVGNFNEMIHRAANGNWTRAYAYDEVSLIETGRKSNRLSRTALHRNGAPISEPYAYDAHGNIAGMPHLPLMAWNFRDELSASARQSTSENAPETTYYVYDAGGHRARKVTERRNGSRKSERLYVGGFETYREFEADSVAIERQSLHVMDDKRRIALIETRTICDGATIASPKPTLRYQLGNHLGSASLELDETGELVSYEEYSPYGNTPFQAGRSAAEISLKRYRYTGKERDEENGFTYHGKRYYAPWLGRWTAPDPSGLVDGPNLYAFVKNNSINAVDSTGGQGEPPEQSDVGAPGFGESLIPVWGSGRAAIHDFQTGHWGWGILQTGLAITDVFLVKALVTGIAKGAIKASVKVGADVLAAREAAELAAKEAAELAAKEAAAKELAAKELAAKEAAAKELAAKQAAAKQAAAKQAAAKEAAAKEAAAKEAVAKEAAAKEAAAKEAAAKEAAAKEAAAKEAAAKSAGATFSKSQLQHAFKHAKDFGVVGNQSNKTLAEFATAIQKHIADPATRVIQGTYRGLTNVTHFVNPTTGLDVIRDASGKFISGWKLSTQQLSHVLTSGKLGGGL